MRYERADLQRLHQAAGAMNYYERHIGDHAKLTLHLSMLEHGALILLMDRYYATEAPIPAAQAHRIAKARSKEERDAVDVVLSEFFQLQGDAWHHAGIASQVAEFQQGEPERKAKEQNEQTRTKRHREERARLFSELNAHGIHMPWNAPIAEVRANHARTCNGTSNGPVTPPVTAPVTLQAAPVTPPVTASATPVTATHLPLPTSHFPSPTSQESESDSETSSQPENLGGTRVRSRPPSGGPSRKKSNGAGKKIPEDHPTDPHREWAATHTPEVDFDREIAKLRVHEFERPHSDWDAAIRKWLLKAQEFQQPGKAKPGAWVAPPSAEERDTQIVRDGIAAGMTDYQLWELLDQARDAQWISRKRAEVSDAQH